MRALVVGLGHMGTFHYKTLRNLGYPVDTVDVDPKRNATYTSVEEALLDCRYDIAAVAVPINQLVECAFKLVGIKMLVEKPFAPTPREAAMLGAYLTAQAPVCVGYLERFNPLVADLKARLAFPHVRAARFIRWSDKPSPDPIIDLLTHDIDLARYLFTEEWGERAVGLCSFDYKCDQPAKVRRIEVDVAVPVAGYGSSLQDETWTVDLMDHDLKPTIALWHAFLMGDTVPTPKDAVAALHGAYTIADREALKEWTA